MTENRVAGDDGARLVRIGPAEIRRAAIGDAAALARMRVASSLERHGDDPAERAAYEVRCAEFFAAQLANPESFLLSWVALSEGAVVGGASLAVFPTLPRYKVPFGGKDGRIRDVYVDPAYRRRGIARDLMHAVMREAAALQLDRLTLGASTMGRPLYESLGFVGKLDEMVYDSG